MREADPEASIRPTLSPRLADVLVAAAWIALALDSLGLARRERRAGARVPDAGGALRAAFVAALLVMAFALEGLTGRWHPPGGLALVGAVLAASGLALHARARRALGPHWSTAVRPASPPALVEHGPYARVRHPIYLALVLLVAGSFLAHPSPATACLAAGAGVGIGLKVRLEERVLRAALGADYARYAERVPALVPRLSRR